MAQLTRRVVVQAIGMAATAAIVPAPVAAAAAGAPAGSTTLPPPPLDIEAWFGPDTMANIKRIYQRELGPECDAGQPPHLTEAGRFNISPAFRYAFAKLLNEGPDVLLPDEPGLHRHYRKILHNCGKSAGVSVYGFVGELSEPAHPRMILLTRDRWVWSRARKHWPIEPFRAYQWLGDEDVKGLIVPTEPARPRPEELGPAPSGRALSFEQRMAIFDAECARDPLFDGEIPYCIPTPPSS